MAPELKLIAVCTGHSHSSPENGISEYVLIGGVLSHSVLLNSFVISSLD